MHYRISDKTKKKKKRMQDSNCVEEERDKIYIYIHLDGISRGLSGRFAGLPMSVHPDFKSVHSVDSRS